MSANGATKKDLFKAIERLQTENSKLHEVVEMFARASEPLLKAFDSMKSDHYEKLVHHQTLESASENWDKLLQEPMEFGPLIQAYEVYKKHISYSGYTQTK